ncbi:MAG: ParB N-terminal domain-containing protein [Candidatus Heimdallarchaeota archaeon]
MPGVEKRTEGPKPFRELPITWVALSELKPHEALNEEELKGFIESVTRSGVFWLPLLITKKEKIILDGHHRWAGLRKLGARRAPGILIDYEDPEINLGIWFPLLTKEIGIFLAALENNDIKTQIVPERQLALNAVQSGNAKMAIVGKTKEEAILVLDDPLAVDILTKEEGESICYIDTESAALSEVDRGEARFAIIRKPLTKADVRQKTDIGEVFAAKSTRHILPWAYQKIEVKLEEIIPNFHLDEE